MQGASRLVNGLLGMVLSGIGLYIIPDLKLKALSLLMLIFCIYWTYSSRRFLNKLNKPPKK